GQIGIQAQALPFGSAVLGDRLEEFGVENHSRGLVDLVFAKTQGERLRDRALGAADIKLLLPLKPEVGRIIGQIRQDCYQRRRGRNPPQALKDGSVEVRDKGDDQGGLALPPVRLQQAYLILMVESDGGLQHTQSKSCPPSPAFLQQPIVEVL